MKNRDKVAQMLPGHLVDDLLPDGGFSEVVSDFYRVPSNCEGRKGKGWTRITSA